MKRLFDLTFAAIGLLALSPILVFVSFLVWAQDFRSPLYLAPRVGRSGRIFTMYKLRSMVINADKNGVDSTSADDARITKIGKIIRKFKLDELTQLINVVKGDMSLVGPRPNVENETNKYSEDEKLILSVKPGITDFASIIFSDEGEILKGSSDPDLDYNQIIRPWKSRLGIFYIQNQTFITDLKIICYTLLTLLSRTSALKGVSCLLKEKNASSALIKIALRDAPITPSAPPGLSKITS